MDLPENTVFVVMKATEHSTTFWYPNLAGDLCEIPTETNLKPGNWACNFDGNIVRIQDFLPTTLSTNSPLFKITTLVLKPTAAYFCEGNPGFKLRKYSSLVGLSVYFGPIMLSRTVAGRMKEDTLYELELNNFKQTTSTNKQIENTWTIMDTIKTVWFCSSWPDQSNKEFPASMRLDEMKSTDVKFYQKDLKQFSKYQSSFDGNYNSGQSDSEQDEEVGTNESISSGMTDAIRNFLSNPKMNKVMEERDPENYSRLRLYYNETK